ncbi:hypothetical protein MCOR02_001298 [Pyricularia oryzae]|nr:hypothetical protein MCOR02_001298 [Pyricularia oryzae]
MAANTRAVSRSTLRWVSAPSLLSSRTSALPARLYSSSTARKHISSSRLSFLSSPSVISSDITVISSRLPAIHQQLRSFHPTLSALQQSQTPPKESETPFKEKVSTDSESKEDVKNGEGEKDKGQEKEGAEAGEENGEKKKKKQKEDLPPPPTHGDKTPWQVFMETMQTEFKQSKEWNESTKAIAASAQHMAESESVRRARQAYEATSGAVSNTAGTVLKGTASAIGKGASWTWETPVMKGVRKAANVTGGALDEATKPIRETEAYKMSRMLSMTAVAPGMVVGWTKRRGDVAGRLV